MRLPAIITGALILAIGVAYLLDSILVPELFLELFVPALLILSFGVLNVAFGIITAKGTGVSTLSNSQTGIEMIVDRGVIGSSVYIMAFSQSKLVLKKLNSGSVTILSVIVFVLVGLYLGFIIGAAVGGISAFSFQEFLTQRRRDSAMKGNLLDPSRKGDMEFAFKDLERVQLTRARLRLFLKDGKLGIVISRRYPEKMLPVLERIIPKSKMEEAS